MEVYPKPALQKQRFQQCDRPKLSVVKMASSIQLTVVPLWTPLLLHLSVSGFENHPSETTFGRRARPRQTVLMWSLIVNTPPLDVSAGLLKFYLRFFRPRTLHRLQDSF